MLSVNAVVAELADALVSGTSGLTLVEVQVLSTAPNLTGLQALNILQGLFYFMAIGQIAKEEPFTVLPCTECFTGARLSDSKRRPAYPRLRIIAYGLKTQFIHARFTPVTETIIMKFEKIVKKRCLMPIITRYPRVPASIVAGFQKLLANYDSVTCAVADCLERFNAMTADMKPLFAGIRLVGTAVTVKTLASDLAAAFKAIDLCQPGDIVVIDSHGSVNTAFWGENMTMSALNKGAVAAVIDGACRDVEEIRKIKFPVFAKGIVPNVGSLSGYGQVNVPIQCAGVVVCPGDILVIDGNGIVVVPREDAGEILQKTTELLAKESIVQEKIKNGATIGELINVDEIFKQVFAYQNRAVDNK
jgi:4-hydroxy-4-methyl-2-oxoglutarate aldolase